MTSSARAIDLNADISTFQEIGAHTRAKMRAQAAAMR